MTSPTLYGWYASSCTRRALLAFYEAGQEDFSFVPVNLGKQEQKSPEYLAKQPFGLVPFLEDGPVKLFESRAIARYIAAKHGAQRLLGSSLEEKALVDQWLSVEEGTYNAAVIPLAKLYKPTPKGETEAAQAEELKAKVGSVLDIYEKHLKEHRFLAGNEYTLADLSHLPNTFKFFESGDTSLVGLINSRPRVKDWWHRLSSLPAWNQVLQFSAKQK